MPIIFFSIIYFILKINDLQNTSDFLALLFFYSSVTVLFIVNYIPENKRVDRIKFVEKQVCHLSFLLFFTWIIIIIIRVQVFKIEFLLYFGLFIINMMIYIMEYIQPKRKPNMIIKIFIGLILIILLIILLFRLTNSISKIF